MMRQSSNSGRRLRGRPNRNKSHGGTPNRNSTFESNGPEGKVRGNAAQVFEKYLALAREASASGNRVGAEAFFQHAEHYYRIMNDTTDPRAEGQQQGQAGGRDGQRQQHRNGLDGENRGRHHGGGAPAGDAEQAAAGAESIKIDTPQQPGDAAAASDDQSAGETASNERGPRARTPRDQLRRGRAQRSHGGESSRHVEAQPAPAQSRETPREAAPQDTVSQDVPPPAAAPEAVVQDPAPESAQPPATATDGAADTPKPRRSRARKATGETGEERAPRRGRPRKAKAVESEDAPTVEEGSDTAA